MTDQRDGSPITLSACSNQWRLWPFIVWHLIFVIFQIIVMPELAISGQNDNRWFMTPNDKENTDWFPGTLSALEWCLKNGWMRGTLRKGSLVTVGWSEFKYQSSSLSNNVCFLLMQSRQKPTYKRSVKKERKIVKLLSCIRLFATPWTVANQAPPSMGFSRQEYWSGLPFSSPGDLPNPEI